MIAYLRLRLLAEKKAMLPQAHAGLLVRSLQGMIGASYASDAWSAAPLAISRHPDRHGILSVEEGATYLCSVTCLDIEIAPRLERAELPKTLFLLDVPFRIETLGVEMLDPTAWYEEALTIDPPLRVELEWRTPTVFSLDGHIPPLPMPETVFRSWIRRWDVIKPPLVLGEDGVKRMADSVEAWPTLIHGEHWHDERGTIKAYSGCATFALRRNAPRLMGAAFLALSRFAEYAGTGIHTHLGMGVTHATRVEFPLSREEEGHEGVQELGR